MGKVRRAPDHDSLVKRFMTEDPVCRLDVFRLIFTPAEFALFRWKTLRVEANTRYSRKLCKTCNLKKSGSDSESWDFTAGYGQNDLKV